MADFNPYQPPNAHVEDAADDVESELAGRGTRLGAVILDALMFMLPAVFLGFGFAVFSSKHAGGGIALGIAFIVGLLGVVALLIVNLLMLSRSGQTLGKRLLGVKIVRTDGSHAGLARIFLLRIFVPGLIGGVPFAGMVFSIVDPLFIFQKSRRCIHDLIADTIVIQA